jgi:iron complex transport system substrate-binding protein
MQRVLQTVAALLHLPDAQRQAAQVWQGIQLQIHKAQARMPAQALNATVYLQQVRVGMPLESLLSLERSCGNSDLKNIVPSEMGAFPQLNPEYVVRANPDLIVLAQPMVTKLSQRPGWSGISAIKLHRVCTFSAEQADMLVCPGPRLGEAAQLISDCVQSRFAL